MRHLLLLSLAVMSAHASLAADAIPRLALSDGRVLNQAIIRSFDATSGKVLIMTDGTAVLVPIGLLPAAEVEKARAASPSSHVSLVAEPKTAVSPSAPAPEKPARPAAPAETADPVKAHQEAAIAQVKRYYKFEYGSGRASSTVTDFDFEVEETKEVAGWFNRYRTKGKAYVEFYSGSLRRGSYSRETSLFEITTEQKPGEELKVIELTRK